jgi:2-dehydropantoate 2-reductase
MNAAWSTEPLRIGVAGAGAIGCTLATLLARVEDGQAEVRVLARGATLRQMQAEGLTLQRRGERLQARVIASDDAAQLGVQDVLFLCSKSQDLAALLTAARPLVGPETLVIPLVNGVPFWFFEGQPGSWGRRVVQAVDPQGLLLNALEPRQVLGAVTFITAERTGPAQAVSDNPLLIVLGEIDHRAPGPRMQRVAEVLSRAGIEARCVPALRDTLWTKILANLTSNPLSVVSGATLDAIYSDPRLLPIVRRMLQEGLALAAAYGARIPFDPASFIAEGAGMGPIRTSMLQDHLAGRPLELAAIGDAVLELARLQDIAMPVTARMIALAHFREEVAIHPTQLAAA